MVKLTLLFSQLFSFRHAFLLSQTILLTFCQVFAVFCQFSHLKRLGDGIFRYIVYPHISVFFFAIVHVSTFIAPPASGATLSVFYLSRLSQGIHLIDNLFYGHPARSILRQFDNSCVYFFDEAGVKFMLHALA